MLRTRRASELPILQYRGFCCYAASSVRSAWHSCVLAERRTWKFRTWLAAHVQQSRFESYEAFDDARSLFALSSAEGLSLIEATAREVEASEAVAVGNAIYRIFEDAEGMRS